MFQSSSYIIPRWKVQGFDYERNIFGFKIWYCYRNILYNIKISLFERKIENDVHRAILTGKLSDGRVNLLSVIKFPPCAGHFLILFMFFIFIIIMYVVIKILTILPILLKAVSNSAINVIATLTIQDIHVNFFFTILG